MSEAEFAGLARGVQERRKLHGCLLTAWVFLPDHGHAILFPRFPLTLSRVREALKVGATLRIKRARGEGGVLLPGRFFDRAVRTVKEYQEKVEYLHCNPVKAGWVKRPEDGKWSSVHDYTGTVEAPSGPGSPLPVDRTMLPADERTRI